MVIALFQLSSVGAADDWQHPFEADEHSIALYHFDEGQGTWLTDSSKNKSDGQLYGVERAAKPRWVEGKFGNALEFDGLFGWADIPNRESLVGMEKLTVEAWVFIYDPAESTSAATSSLGEIITTPGYSLRMNEDVSRIEFIVCTDGGENENTAKIYSNLIALEEWFHVAGIYDGENCHIFIDGKPADSRHIGTAKGKVKAVMKGRESDTKLDDVNVLRVYSPVSIGGGAHLINAIIDEVRISDCVRYRAEE